MTREAGFPEPIGVLRDIDAPTYDEQVTQQMQAVTEQKGPGDLNALFNSGDTWTVG